MRSGPGASGALRPVPPSGRTPGLGRAAALFFRERRPGPGVWGRADLWLAFQWAGQRLRSGGDVGRATVLAQGIRTALISPYPIYVPFLREELVLEAAWKPVEPSSRSLGSRWLNANPRSSRAFLSQGRARLLQHHGLLSPHTRKLHPKPSEPRRPARGGHEALRASSPRPHPVWSLDHILTF